MTNAVAANGNTGAFRIRFFGADKADHFVIGDLITAVLRNVLVADYLEVVGAFYTLSCVGGVGTNTFSEATTFVRV